jgi:ParB-like chromosome segregation protein Spo0J
VNSINPDTVDTELLQNFKDKLPSAATPSTAPAVSWRAILSVHSAAGHIPVPTDEERRGLAADLERRGQQIPVVLVHLAGDPDTRLQLLDGRTRCDLLEAAGVQIVDANGRLLIPHILVEVRDDTEAEALSLSLNLHRRHLSGGARRKLIAAQIKADPEKSDRQIAGELGASPTTVGTVRAELEKAGEVSNLDTRRDHRGRRQLTKKKTPAEKKTKTRKANDLPISNDELPTDSVVPTKLESTVSITPESEPTVPVTQEPEAPKSLESPPDPFVTWVTFSPEEKRAILDQEGRTGLVTIISPELLGDLLDHVIAQDLAAAVPTVTDNLAVALTKILRPALCSMEDNVVINAITCMRAKLKNNNRLPAGIGVVLVDPEKRKNSRHSASKTHHGHGPGRDGGRARR